MSILINTLLIAMAIQIVMFIPAFIFKTDKLTDLSYAITFIVLGGIVFLQSRFNCLKFIAFSMVLLWAFRLGSFLFARITKMKRDMRFDGIRGNFFKFAGFWLLQGLTVWLIMIPSIYFYQSIPFFTGLSLLGHLIWLSGFVIEAIADHQKFKFKNDKKNKGKWIESGLWQYSRHPNYFGEILCWIGIYTFVVSSLTYNQAIISLVSPLFIIIMLRFITGIPKLEASAEKRYGKNKAFQTYKKRTNVLIPWTSKN